MVYAVIFAFTIVSAGAAVLVLLVGWKSDEERLHALLSEDSARVGVGVGSPEPTIEQLQEHVDAEMVGLDEFARKPSARSLYAVGEGAGSAA